MQWSSLQMGFKAIFGRGEERREGMRVVLPREGDERGRRMFFLCYVWCERKEERPKSPLLFVGWRSGMKEKISIL